MPKKLIALLLLAVAGSAFAQPGPAAWPAKPVRVIIPYPPGGGAEAAARFLANHFTQAFGQSFVIDNRPGGNTVIGAESAAKAAYGKVGHEPAASSGDVVRARIVAEQKNFAKAVKDANLKPE